MNAKKVTDEERKTLDEFDRFWARAYAAYDAFKHYRLGPNHEVEACSLDEWLVMFQDAAGRTVAKTMVDGAMVSTVFLGHDMGWGGPVPITFETMVFPGGEPGLESDMDRYATWDEAVAGHEDMVRKARNKVVQFRKRK